jgi:hypothetical protein
MKCIVNELVTLTTVVFRSGSTRLSGDIPLVVAAPYDLISNGSGEDVLFSGRNQGDSFIIDSSENIYLEGFAVVGQVD